MAFHQFGLMDRAPGPGKRFDRYEPDRFGCIRVKDDLIDEILGPLCSVFTFWHATDQPARGLDEAGITLIPPESAGQIADMIGEQEKLQALHGLLVMAKRTQKWIIHFGI